MDNINLPDLIFSIDPTSESQLLPSNSSFKPSENKCRLIIDTPFNNRSIVSYGLIVYAQKTKKWVIIQRKHSVEFLLFIRGYYRLTYLPILLSRITMGEAELIQKCLNDNPDIFKQVFLEELGLEESGLEYALIRMAESRQITLSLLQKFDLTQNRLTWTWPKGRPLYNNTDRESPYACARREFMEEVEIKLPPPLYLSDTYLTLNFHALNGRIIESRYWIYVIAEEVPIPPLMNHSEVSTRLWASTEECDTLIGTSAFFKQVQDIITNLFS